MSDPVIIALCAALPGLFAFISSLLNRRKLKDVHGQFNSRMDQLIKEVKLAALAQGRLEGAQAERDLQSTGNGLEKGE